MRQSPAISISSLSRSPVGVAAQINAGQAQRPRNGQREAARGHCRTCRPSARADFPGFTALSWVGFFVPAKTPPEVTAKLHDAIDAIVKDADMQQRLAALGFDPVTGTQSEAHAMFKSEVAKWGKMVTTLGLAMN